MPINYDHAANVLAKEFAWVEACVAEGCKDLCENEWRPHFDSIFASKVQAYREVLVGCALVRLLDRAVDIRRPYVNQGTNAYNGRTLDEQVINPFFQVNRIPSTKGPFLSTFRRSVRFDAKTREGLRDKKGYDSLLALIAVLEGTASDQDCIRFLRCLLWQFIRLRETAQIALSRVQRLSLDQLNALIAKLLEVPSGGRIPVLIVVATLRTINEYFGAGWEINYQDINVADSQTGVGGDITVMKGGAIEFAAEVTERPLLRDRIVQTFHTKIAPNSISDYLFFVRLDILAKDAGKLAQQYFAQGHEVNFLAIREWITMTLATVGASGRGMFLRHILDLLARPQTPSFLKVAWNRSIADVIGN